MDALSTIKPLRFHTASHARFTEGAVFFGIRSSDAAQHNTRAGRVQKKAPSMDRVVEPILGMVQAGQV